MIGFCCLKIEDIGYSKKHEPHMGHRKPHPSVASATAAVFQARSAMMASEGRIPTFILNWFSKVSGNVL